MWCGSRAPTIRLRAISSPNRSALFPQAPRTKPTWQIRSGGGTPNEGRQAPAGPVAPNSKHVTKTKAWKSCRARQGVRLRKGHRTRGEFREEAASDGHQFVE